MMRRIPLWLTLVPLLVAVGIYWLFWTGWARDFKASLQPWLPGAELAVTGFPYRLETGVTRPSLALGDVVKINATAARARLNRGPWQPQLTVISAETPRFSAIVGSVLSATVAGKAAAISVNVGDGRLARLSTRIEAAAVRLGVAAVPITADSLELHVREPAPADATASAPPGVTISAPAGAVRGQLVIAGERLRFGNGDALTLAADIGVTGGARLRAYDVWASTGTTEIRRFTLADAHGEVASIRATAVPTRRIGVRYAGTIDTICPRSVAALTTGSPPVAEQRLRTAVRLAFEGSDGGLKLTALPADLARRPVRGQLPPCPVLRR